MYYVLCLVTHDSELIISFAASIALELNLSTARIMWHQYCLTKDSEEQNMCGIYLLSWSNYF